jgi:hypothetical protein
MNEFYSARGKELHRFVVQNADGWMDVYYARRDFPYIGSLLDFCNVIPGEALLLLKAQLNLRSNSNVKQFTIV